MINLSPFAIKPFFLRWRSKGSWVASNSIPSGSCCCIPGGTDALSLQDGQTWKSQLHLWRLFTRVETWQLYLINYKNYLLNSFRLVVTVLQKKPHKIESIKLYCQSLQFFSPLFSSIFSSTSSIIASYNLLIFSFSMLSSFLSSYYL